MTKGYFSSEQFIPESSYDVKFDFHVKGEQETAFVKAYLPQSNARQNITQEGFFSNQFTFSNSNLNEGRMGEWRKQNVKGEQNISYHFNYSGEALKYQIDPKLKIKDLHILEESFISPSLHIQSEDDAIQILSQKLNRHTDNVLFSIKNIYRYVNQIPSNETSDLTDAVTALQQNEASCNGKSRLFVALCRAKGIPSRVVGGIILETGKKKTSHLWAEVFLNGHWVPFDALNQHFAYLPQNYMQLYYGDHFLIKRSKNIEFDYVFDIEKKEEFSRAAMIPFTLWSLPTKGEIPMELLKVILLLPLCSLIIALFRNVIGIKTFGIFLPAIITISLESVGLMFGIVLYLGVVSIVGLLHFPLTRWGLLYTPKLVIILIGVVVGLLGLTHLGIETNNIALSSVIFFPIVILSIAAEKFAKIILEEGIKDALKIQGQTLAIIILCYGVYQSNFLTGFFLTFPESLAIIVSIMLLLGRWIGLRVTEYKRFSWIIN